MSTGITVFCAIALQTRAALVAPYCRLEVAGLAVGVRAHFIAWASLVIALGALLPRGLVVFVTTGLVASTGLSAQALAVIPPWLTHIQCFAWAVQPVPALDAAAMSGASSRVVAIATENV